MPSFQMDNVLRSSKEYLINHIFLPLRLPQQDDESSDNDQALCTATLRGIKQFAHYVDCKDWGLVEEMLSNLLKLYQFADLDLRIQTMTDMLVNQVDAKGAPFHDFHLWIRS